MLASLSSVREFFLVAWEADYILFSVAVRPSDFFISVIFFTTSLLSIFFLLATC